MITEKTESNLRLELKSTYSGTTIGFYVLTAETDLKLRRNIRIKEINNNSKKILIT